MQLEDVVNRLGLEESAALLSREWECSQRAMPQGELPFLADEHTAWACQEAYLPKEIAQVATPFGRRIASCSALSALAWHFHHCLVLSTSYSREDMFRWPSLEGALQDDAGTFYLLVLLSGLPHMQAIHRAHAVPADVVRDTVLDVKLWLEVQRRQHPHSPWGLTPYNVGWLANHIRGEIYRLVRLQFQFATFGYPLRAFRHLGARTVVAIAEKGVRFQANGGRDASQPDEPGAWTSRLVATDEAIIANPILPTGRALAQEVRLLASEWEQVLAPGQPALNLHIPAGGPLDHRLCGESFQRAMEFFPRHFPERPFDVFCCGSWLLNAQIEQFLPASSNIVRFQREFYLFPIPLDSRYLLSRVFGEVPDNIAVAPRKTGFQRALAEFLHGGGRLQPSGGGCFLLPEDLDWGAQVYRRQDFPW